jgi:hypothetical protein
LPVDLLRFAGIYLARGYCAQFNQNVVGYASHLIGAPVSILVLAGTMALRQMGLVDDIIIACGLLLGSIAVTFTLTFGLGAREIAARELGERAYSIKSRKKT